MAELPPEMADEELNESWVGEIADEDMMGDMGDDTAADAEELAGAEDGSKPVADGKDRKKKGDGAADGAALLCLICGVNQRNKKQWFCSSPCGGDVRAAERDAKLQGAGQLGAFKKLRKKGGTEFVTTVNVYKAKCSGFGRGFKRPAFEWLRYYMAIVYSSVMQKGSKMLWLTKMGFCKHKENEEGLSPEQASLEWERELEKAPKGRISADRLRILTPVEDFVVTFNQRAEEEHLEFGMKDKKTPTSHDIQERAAWMGEDHSKFTDDKFTSSLGLGGDIFKGTGIGDGDFAKSSRSAADPERLAEERQSSEDAQKEIEKKEAEKKEKIIAKKRKEFEDNGKNATVSTMEPEFKGTHESLRGKSQRAIDGALEIDLTIAKSGHGELFSKGVALLKEFLADLKNGHYYYYYYY